MVISLFFYSWFSTAWYLTGDRLSNTLWSSEKISISSYFHIIIFQKLTNGLRTNENIVHIYTMYKIQYISFERIHLGDFWWLFFYVNFYFDCEKSKMILNANEIYFESSIKCRVFRKCCCAIDSLLLIIVLDLISFDLFILK